jgi:hypothetical protein
MAKTKTTKTPVEQIKDFCSVLHSFGIARVEAEYCGSGDSGDFDTIMYDYEANDTANTSQIRHTDSRNTTQFRMVTGDGLLAALDNPNHIITKEKLVIFEDNLFQLLPGGWEIDAGSFGSIIVDVARKAIHVHHNERIEDVNSTTYDF